jgi:hypothetical protein
MADKPANTPNVTFRDDGCIQVRNVRLSYPHLFKPWGMNEGDDKKYSAKFLLDKKTHAADIKALGGHIAALQQEAFKGRIPNDKLFLRDGDQEGKDTSAGQWVIAASESKRPDVINRDKTRINEDDDIVYPGCFVNVLIRPWSQNNKFGKRINANLLAVQFVRDGERFSGIERPDTDTAFDDISGEFDGANDDDGSGSGSTGGDDPFA